MTTVTTMLRVLRLETDRYLANPRQRIKYLIADEIEQVLAYVQREGV